MSTLVESPPISMAKALDSLARTTTLFIVFSVTYYLESHNAIDFLLSNFKLYYQKLNKLLRHCKTYE